MVNDVSAVFLFVSNIYFSENNIYYIKFVFFAKKII